MWSDSRTTVQEMRMAVAAFVDERDWARYHEPVNVASAALVEAAELLEPFRGRVRDASGLQAVDPWLRRAP